MTSDRRFKAFELVKYFRELREAGNDEETCRELLRRKIRRITLSKSMDYRFAITECGGEWWVFDRDGGYRFGPFESEAVAHAEAEYREG